MENFNQLTKTAKQELVELAIDTLDYYRDYAADLHNAAYNSDYFIVGRYEAEQWLQKNFGSVFNAIDVIQEYEKFNFGQTYTDLSSPENILNMFTYIVGEEILAESPTLQTIWNHSIDDDDAKTIQAELRELL